MVDSSLCVETGAGVQVLAFGLAVLVTEPPSHIPNCGALGPECPKHPQANPMQIRVRYQYYRHRPPLTVAKLAPTVGVMVYVRCVRVAGIIICRCTSHCHYYSNLGSCWLSSHSENKNRIHRRNVGNQKKKLKTIEAVREKQQT